MVQFADVSGEEQGYVSQTGEARLELEWHLATLQLEGGHHVGRQIHGA